MPDFHRLDAQADAPFLGRDVADPLSRVAFRPTNAVALCATCGLVSLRETWEACGGCPNGHSTAAPWDAALAARSVGDGARTPPPRPAPPVPAPAAAPLAAAYDEPPRRTGLWIALGVGALLVAALGVFALLNRTDDTVAPPPADTAAGPSAPQAVAAEAGDTEGELADGDFQNADGFYQDLYTFAADSSGRTLTFTVESETIYPDVVVTGPDGTVSETETVGSPDDPVRRVSVTGLRGPGAFQVLVSSRRRAATGPYTLRIRQEEPVIALTSGKQASGTLSARSPQADGFYRDTYSFAGATEREHTITVRSGAFTPTVVVTGPAGAVRGQSAPTSGGVVYRFTPTQAGTYKATVSTSEKGKTGAYTVLLAVAPAPPPPPPKAEVIEATAGTLRAGGAPVRDSLDAGAQKTYAATGRIGDRISAEVRTDGFTPTIALIGPDGQRTSGTSDGDRARVSVTLPSDGRFRVVVGSASGAGAISVSLEARAAVTSAPIPRTPGADLPRAPAPAPTPAPPTAPTPGSPDYRPQPLGGNNQPD